MNFEIELQNKIINYVKVHVEYILRHSFINPLPVFKKKGDSL